MLCRCFRPKVATPFPRPCLYTLSCRWWAHRSRRPWATCSLGWLCVSEQALIANVLFRIKALGKWFVVGCKGGCCCNGRVMCDIYLERLFYNTIVYPISICVCRCICHCHCNRSIDPNTIVCTNQYCIYVPIVVPVRLPFIFLTEIKSQVSGQYSFQSDVRYSQFSLQPNLASSRHCRLTSALVHKHMVSLMPATVQALLPRKKEAIAGFFQRCDCRYAGVVDCVAEGSVVEAGPPCKKPKTTETWTLSQVGGSSRSSMGGRSSSK